jgi:hypothetical protein
MRGRGAVAVGVLVLLAVAAPAASGPPGQWTRLPGTVVNFAQPGLARTSDGVLHVVYTRKAGTKSELAHVTVSAGGKVGAPAVALGGWSSMSHPDLLRMPDGSLRVFFGGIRSTNPGETNNAMNTATASASGAQWTLQPGRAAQALYAYATSYAGAGLAKNGTPISSWAGSPGLGFHYGVDPGTPDGKIPQSGCCLYNPDIGVDSGSGQAWIGFTSNEKATPGFFVNAIGPAGAQGGRKPAPGALTGKDFVQPIGRTPITGRIGAAGVYLAYGQGYPTIKKIAVWRVDTAKPQLLLNAPGAKHLAVAAAPDGRLWVMWDLDGKIYATRTNRAATRVSPPTTLGPPGSKSVYELDGEGSAGPLDLIANDGQGLWHQQVWPQLQVSGKRAGKTIVFTVADAGDPVAGATVKARGKRLKTAANGRATLANAPSGRVKASASKAGYTAGSTTVR